MRIRSGLWFVFGLVAGGAAGAVGARWWEARRATPVTTAGVFQDVLSAIRQSFVDSLSDDELYVKAAKGVVSTLGDPYSSFLSPDEFRRYREVLRGQGQSVGFTMADGPDGLRVTRVVDGSPADRAGIEPGQFVLRIGDQPTTGMSAATAAWAIRDTADVRVRIRTPGDSTPADLTLEPRHLKLPPVSERVRIGTGLGYIAVRSVSDNAAGDLEDALDDLDAGQLRGLVLDLRGNLGGRLDQAIAIADVFLNPGTRIGAMIKRQDDPAIYTASKEQRYPGLELVVLVDRHTASSAEIIAAALRDNGRARLIGERTYGKGLIQTTIPLGDSIAVRLTTGRWKTPSGRSIMGGLLPDSLVAEPAERLVLSRQLARLSDSVARFLEGTARERLAVGSIDVDTLALTRGDLDRLADLLRQGGHPVASPVLVRESDLLDRELRRLAARMAGDRTGQVRWGLLSDPVVAVGASLLAPADSVEAPGGRRPH